MRTKRDVKNTAKGLITLTLAFLLFSSELLAQESLFTAQPTLRSNQGPQAIKRTPVTVGNADTSFFSVELGGEQLTGYSTSARTNRNSLRSLSGSSFEATRGILIDANGTPTGNYVASESSNGTNSARQVLFRMANGDHYALTTDADGNTQLEEFDHDLMPDCGHDHHDHEVVHGHSHAADSVSPRAASSAAVTLDVLVLYTPEAG